MPYQKIVDQVRHEKLIGVLRTDTPEEALWSAQQLIQGGFRILDITWTIPNAGWVVKKLVNDYGQKIPNLLIGAGTILDDKTASEALSAGAQFFASPVFDPALLHFGAEFQIPVMPGVSTPSEMMNALQAGAPFLKFFPALAAGGPEFLKAVLQPLPNLPVIATGGINLNNMADFFKAGAMAVGIGSPLFPKKAFQKNDTESVQTLIQEALKIRDDHRASLT